MSKNISSFFIGLMMIGSVLLGVYTDFNTGFLLLSEFISLGVFIIVLALPATFIFFGFAITSIACYQGFYTRTDGGANGVGKSTTASVVISCIAILCLNYILATLLL